MHYREVRSTRLHPATRNPLRRAGRCLSAALCLAAMAAVALPAAAAKPPQQIRQHLLEDADQSVTSVNSVEPFQAEAIDELLTAGVWKVAYATEGNDGESMVFMAVHDGEVLRLHRFDQPRMREGFVKLLPADLRVRSDAEARRIVSAAL
ncbi:MAG: hypothetical protein GVY32_02225, partial [Gammaproteobacteria bacterium]|nr:hypothetical protein [Gammaproteobacteria bacterium]